MREAALDDLKALEREMLSVGSFFVQKFEAAAAGDAEQLLCDRGAVLHSYKITYYTITYYNIIHYDMTYTILYVTIIQSAMLSSNITF